MSAVQFAYDYIYHYDSLKEKHPNISRYRFGRLRPRNKAPVKELFRGLYFETKEQYEAFMTQIQNKQWHLTDVSSWTVDRLVSHHFAVVPYVEKKRGYCGVVVKAVNIPTNDILFDSLLAHWEFERKGMVIPEGKPYTDELEIVLKPTTVEVAVVKQFIYEDLEKQIKEEKMEDKS